MPPPIAVVLVEQSVAERQTIRQLLEQDGDIQVVGEGEHPRAGLDQTRKLNPDLVVTGVCPGQMSGLEMIRRILRQQTLPILVLSSSLKKRTSSAQFECLCAGASAIVQKPFGLTPPQMEEVGQALRRSVRTHHQSHLSVAARYMNSPETSARAAEANEEKLVARPAAIGIVSSTGGPKVLSTILVSLPEDYPIPILLVQHIISGFEGDLASWLFDHISLTGHWVKRSVPLRPGLYIGPNGKDLVLSRGRSVGLLPPTGQDRHCPSGDRLLTSLAETLGPKSAGVILTGMGQDGMKGLGRIRSSQGQTVAQDKRSSLIWGMPGKAVESGAAQHQLSPARIAGWLLSLSQLPTEVHR